MRSFVKSYTFAIVCLFVFASASKSAAQVEVGKPLDSDLTVEAISFGQKEVKVYWNPIHGATSYSVIRDSVEIAHLEGDRTSFTDSTVKPGQTCRYSVTAIGKPGARPDPGSQDYFTIIKSHAYVERSYDPLTDDTDCDVLVVGATTAGVAAAVTASKYGLKVVL